MSCRRCLLCDNTGVRPVITDVEGEVCVTYMFCSCPFGQEQEQLCINYFGG